MRTYAEIRICLEEHDRQSLLRSLASHPRTQSTDRPFKLNSRSLVRSLLRSRSLSCSLSLLRRAIGGGGRRIEEFGTVCCVGRAEEGVGGRVGWGGGHEVVLCILERARAPDSRDSCCAWEEVFGWSSGVGWHIYLAVNESERCTLKRK